MSNIIEQSNLTYNILSFYRCVQLERCHTLQSTVRLICILSISNYHYKSIVWKSYINVCLVIQNPNGKKNAFLVFVNYYNIIEFSQQSMYCVSIQQFINAKYQDQNVLSEVLQQLFLLWPDLLCKAYASSQHNQNIVVLSTMNSLLCRFGTFWSNNELSFSRCICNVLFISIGLIKQNLCESCEECFVLLNHVNLIPFGRSIIFLIIILCVYRISGYNSTVVSEPRIKNSRYKEEKLRTI